MSEVRAKQFNVNQVKIISQSLLNSYSYDDGFPILKELIQNADDANATEIRLYYYAGKTDADNPLLRSPGVIVYDDGEFSAVKGNEGNEENTNEYGVLSIGGIDKEVDKDKIGKFGLGMKSIFHICGMFFYYVNEHGYFGAINPYADADGNDKNPNHKGWNSLTDNDQSYLKSIIDELMPEKHGFTVIIPCAFPIKENAIEPKFPFNKDDFDYRHLVENLSQVFAMLPKVSANKKGLAKFYYKTSDSVINLSTKNGGDIDTLNVSIESIKNTNAAKSQKIELCAYKDAQIKTADGKKFFEVITSKIDDDSGTKLIDDKTTSNQKVCLEILKTPAQNENAKLTVKYCVFLPLHVPSNLCVEINSKYNYTILIDGSFLIDQGRKGIEGFEHLASSLTLEEVNRVSTSDWAKQVWNQIVAQFLVFPSLPKVFEKAEISGLIDSDNDFTEILKRLSALYYKDKNLFSDFATNLYGFAKVYVFDATKEKLVTKWQLLDWSQISKNGFVYVPESKNLENTLSVFPALKDGNAEIIFVAGDKGSNYFLPKNYAPSSEIIKDLISGFSKETIVNRAHIDILVGFLRPLKCVFSDDKDNKGLCKILIQKIKWLLSAVELSQLSSVKSSLAELFNTINEITGESECKIYPVDKKEIATLSISDDEWSRMWKAESDFILVPNFIDVAFNPTEEKIKKLILGTEENRANSVCTFLIDNNLSGKAQHEILESLTKGSLKKHIKEIIANFKEIKIFEIINVKTKNKREYKSSTEFFERILRAKRLFNSVGITIKETEPIFVYANLIPNLAVYALVRKDDDENFGIEEDDKKLLLENDYASVLDSLKHQNYENLDYADDYKATFVNAALREIYLHEVKDDEINFYRFMLAGFKMVDYSRQLYIFATECDLRWKKVFEICKNPNDVLIPKEFDDCIKFAQQNQKKLNVVFLKDHDCFKQLYAYALNNPLDFILENLEFHSPEFLTSILEKMSAEPDRYKTLFCELPFQKNYITGEIIKHVDDNCYLNAAEIEFPKGFKTSKVLVKLDDDERIRSFQEKFMGDKILSPGKAVRIVLEEKSDDEDYSSWIFKNLKETNKNEFDEIKRMVWHKKWILTKSDEYCALNEILSSNLLSQGSCDAICGDFDFYTLGDLAISNDEKELLVKKTLVPDSYIELFGILAKKISQNKDFYISFDSADELKSAARNLDSAIKFPLFNIVRELFEDEKISNKEIIFKDFYQKIEIAEPSLTQNVEALKYLNGKEITKGVLNLFCRILKKAVTQNGFSISAIKYPNRNNKWKDAGELAKSDSPRIPPDFLLNENVYEIVIDKADVIEEKESSVILENLLQNISSPITSVDEIKDFFSSWFEKTPTKGFVRLFLYLLRENFREAALNGRDEKDAKENIEEIRYLYRDFKFIEHGDNNKSWDWNYNREEAFGTNGRHGYFRVRIRTQSKDGKTIVRNLLGSSFETQLLETVPSPIIEKPYYNFYNGFVEMTLASIPDIAPESNEYAKDALSILLKRVYRQSDYEIGRLLENIENKSQNTIKSTASDLLRGMKYILRGLNIKNQKFKEFENQFAEIDEREGNKSFDSDEDKNKNKANEERDKLSQKLINEIKHDKKFQSDIFNAVWQKIGIYQYSAENVLFEFFQNADDAVNDLVNCNVPLTDKNRKFIVNTSDSKIIIRHYGRMINYTPLATNYKYKDKFKYDLRNMMSLYASDKENIENDGRFADTGKFGLGFKSVYTICQEPIVRSGELEFKIVAGIYPIIEPPANDFNASDEETRFELNGNYSINLPNIENKFRRCIPFAILFSKQIREISFNEEKQIPEFKVLFSDETNSLGFAKVKEKEFFFAESRSSDLRYMILMKYKDGKIFATEDELPKIWCLTPLDSVKNLPFYINADFELDSGRRNLTGQSEKNETLLKRVAENFSRFLVDAQKQNILSEENYVQILEIILAAFNMQSEQLFKNFAKIIVGNFQRATGKISNGFGAFVDVKAYEQIFSVTPSRYTDSKETELMDSVQDYFDSVNLKIAVITKSARDSLAENISREIDPLYLEHIFDFANERNLTNEILLATKKISNVIPHYKLLDKMDLHNFKLKNSQGEWTLCSKITLPEISDEYSDEIKEFLNENRIFADNDSRSKGEEIYNLRNEYHVLQKEYQSFKANPNLWLPNSFQTNSAVNSFRDSDLLANLEFRSYTPSKTISQLYEDWHKKSDAERERAAEEYYSKLLPSSVYDYEKFITRKKELSDSDWFVLLLLAVYQSHPWCNDVKNKNFLDELNRLDADGNLLEKLGKEKPSKNPKLWIDAILNFLKGKTYDKKYFTWFDEFPSMVQMSEYSNVYLQIFDDLNKLPEKGRGSILTPDSLSEYSGSGMQSAPTAIDMRIGFSFIIREWIRSRELKPEPKVDKFAFMPKAKCVKFVLGGEANPFETESEDLYKKIVEEIGEEAARFDGYYDIPFILEVKPGERD